VSIITTIISFIALREWRKTKKANLAEEIIIIANELNALIRWSRSPARYQNEGSSREINNFENNKGINNRSQEECKNSYHVAVERLNKESHLFAKISILKIKANLSFPKLKISEDLDKYIEIKNEIISASNWIIRTIDQPYKEEMEAFKNAIWSISDKDEISLKSSNATKNNSPSTIRSDSDLSDPFTLSHF
jgi:hypothetical protein